MPYRVDAHITGDDALERLIELGALDAEFSDDGGIAALIPDGISPERVARTLGVDDISVSPVAGRDAESIWILSPRPIQIGRLRIVPADAPADAGALRLLDSPVFGTGLHPTTAVCLEALQASLNRGIPQAALDVGTGSGVLALAALLMGVPRALGIDLDDEALRVAAENARINALDERLELRSGGPETLEGTWPLIMANVLAAPLVEMAPALVRRVGRRGHLILSGIGRSLEQEVTQAYRHLGMRRLDVTSRAGWVAIVLQASW